ncbi:MAG TPA: glycosyltransferase [Flavisolibacter sp.]|nr:glycosyltransferase [Flavisolibacter sp.]
MAVKRILYITYDGLTDPLGQSQILPYIKGLEKKGYEFTILSFEKKARFTRDQKMIQSLLEGTNIRWVPLPFTTSPPLLSKFYDAVRMRTKAVSLHKKYHFDMVHCRSYISADVGLHLKQRYGVKFFFDMRGFWADEKKDGGHWRTDHPVLKRVYQYYKNKEKQYLQHADYVISLTNAGKKELSGWSSYNQSVPLSVIPCCADMDLFSLTDQQQKQQGREALGIAADRLVFSYLGSVGMWYMLEEMLQFFAQVKKSYPNALLLFVTHSDHDMIRSKMQEAGLHQNDMMIMEVPRKEVPMVIKASDINISFIKPVYSKISSSPTKLGEVLSMGIPVICNSGVGDVEEIVSKANAGYVLHEFHEAAFQQAIEAIPDLLKMLPASIRIAVKPIYSLDKGVELYASCYSIVLS